MVVVSVGFFMVLDQQNLIIINETILECRIFFLVCFSLKSERAYRDKKPVFDFFFLMHPRFKPRLRKV